MITFTIGIPAPAQTAQALIKYTMASLGMTTEEDIREELARIGIRGVHLFLRGDPRPQRTGLITFGTKSFDDIAEATMFKLQFADYIVSTEKT